MIVGVVGVTWWGIGNVVRIGTRYSENMERIKRGYPTLEGHTTKSLPGGAKDAGYIDMTEEPDVRYPGSN